MNKSKLSHLWVALVVALMAMTAQQAVADNCYWNNASGDSLWSNTGNWKNSIKPGSNNVDIVYLGNDCPDTAQGIILDEPVWTSAIHCIATGNRHYTITPVADETIRIGYSFGLNGSATRTVDLTINADLMIASLYLRVDCYGGLTTLNGSIGPSPSEQSSVYLAPYISTGWLVLGASNNISEIRSSTGTKLILNHPQAAGPTASSYIRSTFETLLLKTNNITINRLFVDGASLVLGVHESLAGQDVTMNIGYAEGQTRTITTLPRGGNDTFTVNLTGASTQSASWSLAADTILRMTNSILWGRLDWPDAAVVSGAGQVLIEANVALNTTNVYTGGTIIRSGQVDLKANNRLPTNGAVTVESTGILFLGAKSQQVSELQGDGTVRFSSVSTITTATNIVTTLLAPGLAGPGTLKFTNGGTLILKDTTTSSFELDALNATNDRVNFSHQSHLALAGKLRIVNLGGIETGDYTLFDRNGGTISGGFSELILPPRVEGTVEVVSGDVVLRVVVSQGSLIVIR